MRDYKLTKEKDNKDTRINFRVSSDELSFLRKQAKKLTGGNLTELIRKAIFAFIVGEKSNGKN